MIEKVGIVDVVMAPLPSPPTRAAVGASVAESNPKLNLPLHSPAQLNCVQGPNILSKQSYANPILDPSGHAKQLQSIGAFESSRATSSAWHSHLPFWEASIKFDLATELRGQKSSASKLTSCPSKLNRVEAGQMFHAPQISQVESVVVILLYVR
jgi:hypothetical protein